MRGNTHILHCSKEIYKNWNKSRFAISGSSQSSSDSFFPITRTQHHLRLFAESNKLPEVVVLRLLRRTPELHELVAYNYRRPKQDKEGDPIGDYDRGLEEIAFRIRDVYHTTIVAVGSLARLGFCGFLFSFRPMIPSRLY